MAKKIKNKDLEEFRKDGEIDVDSKIDRGFQGTWPEFGDITRIKINDKSNDRFTDATFSLEKKNRRIMACVSHEPGYPSQGKPTRMKCVRLDWLSNKVPE
jgi:hypothetical protein